MSAQESEPWDAVMASSAQHLDQMREAYLEELKPLFVEVLDWLQSSLRDISLEYRAGWDRTDSYAEQLRLSLDKDLKYRTTTIGPHRADVAVSLNKKNVSSTLSRGQIKIVVYALKLAQGLFLSKKRGRKCIYLLDDAPSELDAEHQNKVMSLLVDMNSQVFITGATLEMLTGSDNYLRSSHVFHVEHGQIS